jgi:hypothetical protein
VTITTLGYGDITPIHWFPQFLVFLETLAGIGLVVGFLGMILKVSGERKGGIKDAVFEDPLAHHNNAFSASRGMGTNCG